MTPLAFIVAVLALYRLTLLVTDDAITAPLRLRLVKWTGREAPKRPRLLTFITCPWCVSVWLSGPVLAASLAWSDGWGWWLVFGSLAASAVTGFLASFAKPGWQPE